MPAPLHYTCGPNRAGYLHFSAPTAACGWTYSLSSWCWHRLVPVYVVHPSCLARLTQHTTAWLRSLFSPLPYLPSSPPVCTRGVCRASLCLPLSVSSRSLACKMLSHTPFTPLYRLVPSRPVPFRPHQVPKANVLILLVRGRASARHFWPIGSTTSFLVPWCQATLYQCPHMSRAFSLSLPRSTAQHSTASHNIE